MAAFEDKSFERLLDRIGKNVEARKATEHGSLVEDLLTKALEKDISLSRCKDFDKLAVSPIYNTKLMQDYISSTESSAYYQYARHYIPLLAPALRDKVFKPGLGKIFDWVQYAVFKITVDQLEQSVGNDVPFPDTATTAGDLLSKVEWASLMEDLQHRFTVLHPEGWNGLVKSDDIVVKVAEIATDLIYYGQLDGEINKNLEHIKRQSGEEYAIRVSSALKNDSSSAFFAAIKDRGYFLDSELKTMKDIFPLIMCPSITCPEGFFSETLQGCNKKQVEIIIEILMGLKSVQAENLPENAITFESFLNKILKYYSDMETT
jgi:hypothetical protein